MRMRNQTRLHLEPLEDRCTPSAGPGDAGLPLQPITDAGGNDQVTLQESPSAASEDAGNAISAFAPEAHGVRVLWGESTIIDGARVVTWALVSPHDNTILAAGVTFSLKLAEAMPQPGSGPAGAIASLEFPAVVQDTTFFNHLEIQSNPLGHEAPPGSVNPDRNRVPHFDFHFYGVPEEQVWAIPDIRPPLPAVPAARLAPGYTQAGRSVLQMGRHSGPVWALTDPGPLTTLMLAGYLPDGSQMHFLEPMVSQEVLLGRQDFSIPVPMPRELGRAAPTLYPTSFNAVYQGNAWSFVYSDFVSVGGAASVAAAAVSAPSTTNPRAQELPAVAQRTHLQVAALVDFDARSAFAALAPAAVIGLDAAVERFYPVDPSVPSNPLQAAPVFALNYGDAVDVALSQFFPTDPTLTVSPIFFDLADAPPVVGDLPT